jgi:transcriptional regulator GlxA family with amidase domain
MKRRELLQGSAVLGFMAALPFSRAASAAVWSAAYKDEPRTEANPLKPPAKDSIPVAFLISDGAVIIDFCGPWEVFHNAGNFSTFTVAEAPRAIRAMGGMRIIPNYTFENSPAPKVLVIPAQNGHSPAMLNWIRKVTKSTDVTMSVCTGALLLAKTGLLSGKAATTHHAAYKELALGFPDIQVKRGARFVEDGNLATAGGLSSGIDLALRVVERYYGREAALETAYGMEYQGQGWMNAESNSVYAQVRESTEEHPLCPVCEMDVDPKAAASSIYKGKAYYFCSPQHKTQFEASPAKFADATEKK